MVWNSACMHAARKPIPRRIACMDNETLTITDNRTQQTYTVPIYRGTIRAMDLRQIKAGSRRFRPDDLRPGLHEHRLLPERHHLPGRRQGHPAIPRLPHRATGRELQLPRSRLPSAERRTAHGGSTGVLELRDHAPHHDPREREEVHGRLPPRRAPHGHPDQHGRGALHLLSRRQEHRRPQVAGASRSSG